MSSSRPRACATARAASPTSPRSSGLEGDVIVTQDLFVYEITGEDDNGRVLGKFRSTGIARPRFWDRARYYGLERELAEALDAAE
jgi:pilus assembly protein CpaF